MPIMPLSMSDVETFEKTVKEALKWIVCFIPINPLRINGSVIKVHSSSLCHTILGKLQQVSQLHVIATSYLYNTADAVYRGYKNYTDYRNQNGDDESAESVKMAKKRIIVQENENGSRSETNKRENNLPLLDDTVTIESIIKEDSLYNSFTYQQLRGMYSFFSSIPCRFYQFYRRAIIIKTNARRQSSLPPFMTRMNVWTVSQFTEVFTSVSIEDKEVRPVSYPQPQIIRTMFRVWDYDGDGYVNIFDFVHTYAYSQLENIPSLCNNQSTPTNHFSYIFDCMDLHHNSVVSFQDMCTCQYYLLSQDENNDPERLEDMAQQYTRRVSYTELL